MKPRRKSVIDDLLSRGADCGASARKHNNLTPLREHLQRVIDILPAVGLLAINEASQRELAKILRNRSQE